MPTPAIMPAMAMSTTSDGVSTLLIVMAPSWWTRCSWSQSTARPPPPARHVAQDEVATGLGHRLTSSLAASASATLAATSGGFAGVDQGLGDVAQLQVEPL